MPNTPRILVADDDPDTLGLIELTLETAGYQVETVASGGQALLSARLQPYDLILLDIMMPDISGFDVLRRMQAELPKTPPIVFLTAKNRPEDRQAGEGLGAVAYLVKPTTRGTLLDVIRRALGETKAEHAPD
jgi:DNA-binding response OmpR family regulator